MGLLGDVIEIVRDLKNKEYFDTDDAGNIQTIKTSRTSIIRKAKPAVCQFPSLVSTTVSIENLTMCNKALEREYATFLRIAMGLDDLIMDNDMSKAEYIRKFHSNMDFGITGREQLKPGELGLNDSAMLEANLRGLKNYASDLREDSLNDKTSFRNRNNFVLGESKYARDNSKLRPLSEGDYDSPHEKALIPNDVQKANELVPTTLNITLRGMGPNGRPLNDHILIGVKAISHRVSTEEMIHNVALAIKEQRALFRFIQWTSGEIAFFKDYLLCLDRVKKEAVQQRENSVWWRRLKVQAANDRIRRLTFSKKDVLPNATIVMSMEEVEHIANTYNIDLIKNTRAVKTLMDVYFLLGVVIVDDAAQLVYFMFDGEHDYQTFSFSSLERENRNQGNDVKALVSLMNKM